MACPCYKEDDHAGEDIIADIKILCKKIMQKIQSCGIIKKQKRQCNGTKN